MKDPTRDVETTNLETLSIGVFAIVMTLLVLDIRAPMVATAELPAALLALWPNLLSYAISFALLGIYFLGYTAQFRYINKVDHESHWISFLFLALVTLIPFSTALLSGNPHSVLSIVIYASNLITIGLALYWHWIHATKDYQLVDGDLHPYIIKYAKLRCLVAPVGYFLAILVAFISPTVSLVICVAVPLFYIIPGMQKVFWLQLAKL
ncbi:MAG TPA: TMEM175 family protein [Methanobacteriaceae archaeon]|nr:TMEM175 family protein [Methanobacteriaceae archaeon]